MSDHDRTVEAVLALRAERLRRPLQAPEDEGHEGFVAFFELGDALFAFPLETLRAIVPLRGITPVPLAPPQVLGVVRYQRQLVAAFSLPALLGDRAWRCDPELLLIVERAPGRLVAVDCAEMPRTAQLAQARPERGAPLVNLALRDGREVRLVDPALLGAWRGQGGASRAE